MRVSELVWPEDRIEHISRHQVFPQEVEEVCFGKPLVLRTKGYGPNPVFFVLGQTARGRYLFCLIIAFPDGKGLPITAREMTEKEKVRFKKWREK